MKVNVEVTSLLEKLRTNRKNHRDLFLRAQEAFRKKVEEVLVARLNAAGKGQNVNQYLNLIEPVDQTEEYDIAIAMMEMCSDETIELDQRTFQCYVLDKWSWADATFTSNSAYL